MKSWPGFFWMTLDLPPDASRPELETFAHHLVTLIQAGAGESQIEGQIALLQSRQLCRPARPEIIRALVQRTMTAVRGT